MTELENGDKLDKKYSHKTLSLQLNSFSNSSAKKFPLSAFHRATNCVNIFSYEPSDLIDKAKKQSIKNKLIRGNKLHSAITSPYRAKEVNNTGKLGDIKFNFFEKDSYHPLENKNSPKDYNLKSVQVQTHQKMVASSHNFFKTINKLTPFQMKNLAKDQQQNLIKQRQIENMKKEKVIILDNSKIPGDKHKENFNTNPNYIKTQMRSPLNTLFKSPLKYTTKIFKTITPVMKSSERSRTSTLGKFNSLQISLPSFNTIRLLPELKIENFNKIINKENILMSKLKKKKLRILIP